MALQEEVKKVNDFLLGKEVELNSVEKSLFDKKKALSGIVKEHTQLTDLVVLDSQSAEVVQLLFEKTGEKGFRFMEQLGTQALRAVFTDEDYSLKIQLGSRGKEKTVEFFLEEGGRLCPLKDATGGGIQVLVSFVFRVYYILKMKMRRIVILDEAFSQLSPQYLESFLDFMGLLVEKFRFDFLWISHSPYLEGRVNNYFEVVKGRLLQK